MFSVVSSMVKVVAVTVAAVAGILLVVMVLLDIYEIASISAFKVIQTPIWTSCKCAAIENGKNPRNLQEQIHQFSWIVGF